MSLLQNINMLLSSPQMPYTDILIQADENLRVFSPAGWEDMGMPGTTAEIIEFAKLLTKTQSQEALYALLREQGACNVGCMIGKQRVRVDVSLVSNSFRITENFDTGDVDLQDSVLELCIRRHRTIIPIDQLRLPPKFIEYLRARSGLILLTGQTASGKTSTAASALDYINSNVPAHIVTIEDPIEYIHTNKSAVFSPKEIGRDSPDIATATYDALRQRPDVIFISELRDAASCKEALYAAQSALVIATTHAPSLEEGLERILNFFPNEEITIYRALRSSLRCVVAQTLLPIRVNKGAMQFKMFFEFIQGNNEIVQAALEKANGLTSIRAGLNQQALKMAGMNEQRVPVPGNPMDNVDKTGEVRYTGLVPMNVELAKAVIAEQVMLQDAQRSTPAPENFNEVHSRLLEQKMHKQRMDAAQRVPS